MSIINLKRHQKHLSICLLLSLRAEHTVENLCRSVSNLTIMRTKNLLVLGLVTCWIAVCNAEDGYLYDYGTGNEFSKELAEDYLFRADVSCKANSECSENQKCVGEEDDKKTCQCADGLSGEKCDNLLWCEEKFKNCKGTNGKCKYNKEERSVVCLCDTGKELHPVENICKDTCSKDEDCADIQKCTEKDGWKACHCADGLSGDKCEKNDWCAENGKFANCKGDDGSCEYSNEKRIVECICASGKQFDPLGKRCRDTCSKNEDCAESQKCTEKDGWKVCHCADGLSGDKCEKNDWCTDNGKFENCKGDNGTCEYNKEKRTVECTCASGKQFDRVGKRCRETCKEGDCAYGSECKAFDELHFCVCGKGLSGDKCDKVNDCVTKGKFENCTAERGKCGYVIDRKEAVCTCKEGKKLNPKHNYCQETCAHESECKNEAKCEEKGGNKFCSCNLGLIGDKCQTVYDCSTTGKYKDCESSGGQCKYEGSKAVCVCSGNKKLHDKENKCRECDCGPKGTCKFENGDKKCTCEEGFAFHNGTCREKCTEDDCEYTTECKAFDGLNFCVCTKGLSGDKCEKVNDCSAKGKFENCTAERGKCRYDIDRKGAVCECDDGKDLNPNLNYCQETCTSHEECKEGQCENKFCKCKPEFMGDKCDLVKDCEIGKYSKCKESGGDCGFEGSKSTCKCPDDKVLDEKLPKPICRTKCSTKDDCKNGAECKNGLCQCPEGTEGDDCGKVTACGTLKCEEKDAVCTYDSSKTTNTFCVCKDANYKFDEKEKKCVAKWCEDGCNKDSTCEYKDGVGICKCKNQGSYYDYASKLCKKMDPCFNKKCDGDLICNKGLCECPENYKKKNVTCEPKDLCTTNKCFVGAQCEKGSSLGYVKCLCNSASKFYLPKQSKCDDGVCFLPVERKSCSKACPTGMKRQEGICKFLKEDRNCEKDCGFLGWCEKLNDTEHKCHCDPTYAEMNKETKKCVLKASAVCPTKEKVGDNKCKCVGKYKQAENGITCELKSCSDEEVQNECKMKRAPKCVDNWKNDVGYKCVCPEGYIEVKDKGCIDPCTWERTRECLAIGQMCYVGQKIGVGDCRCPPTFIYDETKKSCDLGGINTYMIHSLPVMRNKYETLENDVNKVLLNIDVSTSMKQAFNNLDFAQVLNFKMDKDVLLCDVWLQFQANLPAKFNANSEVRRWIYQLRETNGELVLLPGLFLDSKSIGSVKEEELTICTASVQQSVCGTGSTCANNTCSCQPGFREIDSTIKASGNKRIVRCEDVNECTEAKHNCAGNSECVNTLGDYFCKCNPGFKKAKGDANAMDKEACIGLCEANPCGKGTCQLTKENTVDCSCQVGYTGSFCNKADVNLAKASKATKVVGAVLGTLLAIVIILIIVYIVKQRKNSYSEDFTPPPRNDNAEMVERRPMRGVTNRAFQ